MATETKIMAKMGELPTVPQAAHGGSPKIYASSLMSTHKLWNFAKTFSKKVLVLHKAVKPKVRKGERRVEG